MITEIQHILPLVALCQAGQSTTENKTNYFNGGQGIRFESSKRALYTTAVGFTVEIRKRIQGHDCKDTVIVYAIIEVAICILGLQWQLVNFIFLCTCHASQGILDNKTKKK